MIANKNNKHEDFRPYSNCYISFHKRGVTEAATQSEWVARLLYFGTVDLEHEA